MNLRSLAIIAALAVAACAALEEPVTTAEPTPAPRRTAPPPPPVAKPKPEIVAPPVVVQPPPAPKASVVEILIAEFERLRRMPAVELAREQEVARQAFNQSRDDIARVKLAMSIALPGGPGNEDLRALELLDPLVKSPAAPLHGFAFLLANFVHEQRRLAAQLQGMQQNVQGLQQSVQALQQKLDALKTLERSLSERGEGSAPRRR